MHLNTVFKMVNVLFLFFTHLLLVFSISNFDFTYNGAFLSSAYVTRTIKFTTFIDESVGKNKLVFSKHGGSKVLPDILRKRLLDWAQKKKICNYPFKFYVNIIQSFQGNSFVQFCILRMFYMYKTTPPKQILSLNFGLFGENFVTSFI